MTIVSINVGAAVPADKTLQSSLAQGAVAAAEAQKFEVVARGRALALKCEAKGQAEAGITRARGDAQAELIRAEGSRKAADLLAGSETAVRFAMVDKTGAAIGQNATFFFGNQVDKMSDLLAPAVVAAATGTIGRAS